MINRRALFGWPLAALPFPAAKTAGMEKAVFEFGHQLRPHLTNVIGFSALLEDESIDPTNKLQYARHISESASAILKSVDDLIDVSERS